MGLIGDMKKEYIAHDTESENISVKGADQGELMETNMHYIDETYKKAMLYKVKNK